MAIQKKPKASLESAVMKTAYPQMSTLSQKEILELVPPATLSIKEIKDAIPKHCFERSLSTSLAYVLYNSVLTYSLLVLAWGIWHGSWIFPFNSTSSFALERVLSELLSSGNLASAGFAAVLTFLYFTAYAVLQGTVTTGLWVIAHECGHHSFSADDRISDFVGWVLHSGLMVPYFAWQHSHGQHHRYTGNLERDTVFIPEIEVNKKSEDASNKKDDLLEHFDEIGVGAAPLFVILLGLVKMFAFGWPTYLSLGLTGPRGWTKSLETSYDLLIGKLSHFRTDSPVFDELPTEEDKKKCVYGSNAGLAIVWTLLAYAAYQTSVLDVIRFYFGPLMVVNFWLVIITFLQHTDVSLPHYSNPKDENDLQAWTYVRGALATIDRGSYGYVIDHLHHHIASTHVLHHLFSRIPHYHAKEATEAISKVLGKYYRYDGVGVCADKGDEAARAISLSKLFWDTVKTYGKCQELKGPGPVFFFFRQTEKN